MNREASALRAVVLLADSFPGEPATRLHALVRRHITEAVTAGVAHDGPATRDTDDRPTRAGGKLCS